MKKLHRMNEKVTYVAPVLIPTTRSKTLLNSFSVSLYELHRHYAVFCVLLIYFSGFLSTNLKLENIIASQTKLKTITARTLAAPQVFKSCFLICCCPVMSIKWLPKIGRNEKTSTRRLKSTKHKFE